MPELPEVESIVRELCDSRPSLLGRKIVAVNIAWEGVVSGCPCTEFQRQLTGAGFASVTRHGKYLLFGLEPQPGLQSKSRWLVIHLRMSGRLYLLPQAEAIARHTRLALILDQGLVLRFDDPRKFGRVWLVDDPAEIIAALGPDALTLCVEEFSARLARHRRQLKALLLDQSFVAGIGNIYADEILHRAGLNPCTNSGDLADVDVLRLHAAIVSVLREAVAARGANIDGVFKAGGFRVNVYARKGKACPNCGTAIVRIMVGQRGTHYCPRCQPLSQTIPAQSSSRARPSSRR